MKIARWAKLIALFSLVSFGVTKSIQLALSNQSEANQQREVVLLEKISTLGNLHTARYQFSEIFTHQTYREPSESVAWIPAADSIVRGSTINEALIKATGTVEAGVDLSRATISRAPSGEYVVTLHSVEIYQPAVRAEVVQSRRGMFWRDENIVPSAVTRAERTFKNLAQQRGIEALAKQEAEKRLKSLIPDEELRFTWISQKQT